VKHEQVREVRAGKQQRGCIGHEDRAVQERPLVEVAPPRGVHEYGRQEDDGGVQVEDGRDGRDEPEQAEEQAAPAQTCRCQPRSERLEESVVGGDGADQQQTCDQHERGPHLLDRG
jgi:hypothetical protein